MEVDVAGSPPKGSMKRKAESVDTPAKRQRRSLSPAAIAARRTSPDSDHSASAVPSGAVSTPDTPASSLALSRQKNLPCSWPGCTQLFAKPSHLRDHLASHEGRRDHVCAACGKTYLRQTHLSRHVANAHEKIREHLCAWAGCTAAFGTAQHLARHHASHEKREPYTCKRAGCGASFRKHKTLTAHVEAVHEQRLPFQCAQPHAEHSSQPCGAGFSTILKLQMHEGNVHGMPRFHCTICTTSPAFATRAQFRDHNRDLHPPECGECGEQAASPSALRKHRARMHFDTGEKSEPRVFSCPHAACGKTFTKRANLVTHIRATHEGKRFVCGQQSLESLNGVRDWNGSDACGRDFSAKFTLEAHIRQVHLGKPNPRAKLARRPRGSQTARAAQGPSVIAQLAGTSYAHSTQRDLPCFVTGCAFRFVRRYDRDVHAKTHHGLGEWEIGALAAAAVVNRAWRKDGERQSAGKSAGKSENRSADTAAADHSLLPSTTLPNVQPLLRKAEAQPTPTTGDEDDDDEDEDDSEDGDRDEEDEVEEDWATLLEEAAQKGDGPFWLGGGSCGPEKPPATSTRARRAAVAATDRMLSAPSLAPTSASTLTLTSACTPRTNVPRGTPSYTPAAPPGSNSGVAPARYPEDCNDESPDDNQDDDDDDDDNDEDDGYDSYDEAPADGDYGWTARPPAISTGPEPGGDDFERQDMLRLIYGHEDFDFAEGEEAEGAELRDDWDGEITGGRGAVDMHMLG